MKSTRKLKQPIPFVSLFLVLCCLLSCNKDGITLVANGHTDYEIVLSENASEAQSYAAKQLQVYLHKISAVEIPIVSETQRVNDKHGIFIHKNIGATHKLGIETNGKDLIISGGSDTAVLNAVYEFLEVYLNCKWYTPKVEEVPNLITIKLDHFEPYIYEPPITTRTVHSRLFYKHHEFADKHKVTDLAFPKYAPSARVHTFHKFIPEEKFFRAHPEYFALRNGIRVPTQLCLTNSEVLSIVNDSVAALFHKYPTSSVVSVSQKRQSTILSMCIL